MRNLIFLTVITIFILSSCSSKIDTNDSLPDKVKWRYILETKSSENVAPIWNPIIDGDIVIIPRKNYAGKKGELIALNKHDGSFLWSWSEAFEKYGKDGFSITSYVHDGILAIGDDSYTAGINIQTGETIWENIENINSLTAINGVNDLIFKSAIIPNQKVWIQKANIYDGKWETIHELDEVDGYNLDSYTPVATEWEGKTYITFHDVIWRIENGNFETTYFLNLYNVTDDRLEWKTDTIPIDSQSSHTPGIFPVFNEGQILIANEAIYSYNLSDGKLKWKRSYDRSFTLSTTLAAENGKVYGNNSDLFFVCLDVHTGEELFNVDSGGSPSWIKIHDEKCYMSAVTTFTDSQLMIFDANTGAVKESIISPFKEEDEKAIFNMSLEVDQETGYAYTADFKNFICFDFE